MTFDDGVAAGGDMSLCSGVALAGLSAYELWIRCAGRGCRLTEAEIGRAMFGADPLPDPEYELLVGVLDDELRVLGCDRRVRRRGASA